MPIICPTILAQTAREYRHQLELVATLSERLQIDFADATLGEQRTINLEQLYWPTDKQIDIHLMTKRPTAYVDTIIALQPSLAIVHQATPEELDYLSAQWRAVGVRCGLAMDKLLSKASLRRIIPGVDHLMIYSGSLGRFGGRADVSRLQWVKAIKEIDPKIEIGWDGGVNSDNITQLAAGSIDVINVGSYLHGSDRPQAAYDILKARIAAI